MNPNCRSHRNSSGRRHRRAGYLYVAVLFTSMIIVAVVTASLTVSTAHTHSQFDRVDRLSAVRLAESEIHRVASHLSRTEPWRTEHTDATFTPWLSLSTQSSNTAEGVISSDTANAQVRYRLSDTDGDLADDVHDDVVLTTNARVGKSQAAIAVTLQNAYPPLPILDYCVTTTDDLEINSSGRLSTDGPVQISDDCQTDSFGSLITPHLKCSGSIQLFVRGDIEDANVVLPPQDIVDTYADLATNIPIASLPSASGFRQINDVVLSASENPFGAIDSDGIYRIDAQGARVRISHCRILATLVFQNCPLVEVAGGINWSFPNQADAILVTDGNIRFEDIDATLDESARGSHFNPATTPYRGTDFNSNQTDVFPTQFRGIIYAENNIECFPLTDNLPLDIAGALICRDLRVTGSLSIARLSELVETPPVAFSDWQPLQFVRGSFRRVETP